MSAEPKPPRAGMYGPIGRDKRARFSPTPDGWEVRFRQARRAEMGMVLTSWQTRELEKVLKALGWKPSP